VIPVIGIPYINQERLLARLLDSIPDDLYDVIHIIDNSPDGLHVTQKPRVIVTRMHRNIGVGAAWNLIIKAHPFERWWAILNSDVEVDRENLERLIAGMKVHDLCYLNGMAAFGIRASCVEKVGWFDENYVPAYCEDIDYDYRCRLLGVHIEVVGRVVEHYGSATLKGSKQYQRENGRSYPANRRYYGEKWGGFVGEETYTTPFDRGGSPRDWSLDMRRLSSLSWKE
jgi:GT2 family glycosyltransferase